MEYLHSWTALLFAVCKYCYQHFQVDCANNDAGKTKHPTLKNRRKTLGTNPLWMINISSLIDETFVFKSEPEFLLLSLKTCAFYECLFIL